jgi:hypothetical protein
MSMFPESRKTDKWLVYPLGCGVFVGILYFGLWRLVGLAPWVSLAAAIPGGVVGFFILAMIAENWESGGWDDGGA